MLSIETEARVAKLFLNLAEGEKSVEINRQVLSEQLDFDPYQVFKRLDSQGKNNIDEYDVVDFLKVNSVYSTYQEARTIIFFYDSDGDGSLNYAEFLNLVLSDYNYTLRRIARERIGLTYNRLTLPYDVEYSLTKLFERELDLVRNVDLLLSDVKARYDFNVYDLFSSMQSYASYLTSDSIRKFFVRNEVDVSENDIRAILKRLDTDRDTRITLTEFKRFFALPAYPSKDLSSSYTYVSKNTDNSLSRDLGSTFYKSSESLRSRFYSPNRSVRMGSPFRSTYRSPVVTRSPLRTTLRSPVRSPVRSPLRSPLRTTLRNPVRTLSPLNRSVDLNKSLNRSLLNTSGVNFSSTAGKFTSTPNLEEETFIGFLKDLISIENEIERSKCDLVLRSDFNVEDAFRIFELDGRGYVTDLDIKYGLNALDIFPTSEEVNLILKRYDARNEGVLSYSSFFDLVAPYDREYRRMLENRLPNAFINRYDKTEVFLPTTKLYLQNLLTLIIRSESRIEAWRQRLNRMVRFNTRIIFEKIDRLEKNYVTESDFVNYFRLNDLSFLSKDVDLLVLRFDRDRDGRISYLEFSDEIYPKSKEIFVL